MHPMLLDATVRRCREYLTAGDCHGPAPSAETLIDAVVQLADATAELVACKEYTPLEGRYFVRSGVWIKAAPESPVGETLYRRTAGVEEGHDESVGHQTPIPGKDEQ